MGPMRPGKDLGMMLELLGLDLRYDGHPRPLSIMDLDVMASWKTAASSQEWFTSSLDGGYMSCLE